MSRDPDEPPRVGEVHTLFVAAGRRPPAAGAAVSATR